MKLSEKAMLVHISGHMWTGRRKNKNVARNVCVQENAEKDVIDVIVNLVPPSELQPISQARSRVDIVFKRMTLPWMDGGLRILPSAMYMEYREKMKEPIAKYNKAVDTFAKRYPDLVANAPKRLGNLAAGMMLPTTADIEHRFRIEQDILPLPTIADFRIDAGDAEAKEIKEQAMASLEASMQRSVQDVWGRLSDLVGSVVETLSQPDKKFRDSLITKLKNFCTLIPKFNITDNADLEKVRQDVMSKLAELDPEDLREIPNNRKKAAKDAVNVFTKICNHIK